MNCFSFFSLFPESSGFSRFLATPMLQPVSTRASGRRQVTMATPAPPRGASNTSEISGLESDDTVIYCNSGALNSELDCTITNDCSAQDRTLLARPTSRDTNSDLSLGDSTVTSYSGSPHTEEACMSQLLARLKAEVVSAFPLFFDVNNK